MFIFTLLTRNEESITYYALLNYYSRFSLANTCPYYTISICLHHTVLDESILKAEVQKVQAEYLQEFRDIQEQMKREAAEGGDGSSSASNKAELEGLKAENAALKVKLAKKEYRIKHLVQSVEELLP
jgi:hypothetical protein